MRSEGCVVETMGLVVPKLDPLVELATVLSARCCKGESMLAGVEAIEKRARHGKKMAVREMIHWGVRQ
jgi:hypothetical protein